jgi:plastocyanin
MKPLRRILLAAVAVALGACGQNPPQTEHARGVLSGANVVLALSIVFIVVALLFVVGALALDRAVKARRALAAAPAAPPEEEEDEQPEVVAGIVVGRAPVPRWLYGFYVLIPLFAVLYVVNAVALTPKKPAHKVSAGAQATGPVTSATVTASGIKFSVSSLTVKANSPITITFKNEDAGVPHNFSVFPSQAVAQAGDTSKAVKLGNTITGVAMTTETFSSGPPGTLYFECTIHPTSMFGTITVSSAPAVSGGGGAASTSEAIAASGIKFDKSTLHLKANSTVTVTFTNNDAGVPHNFTVWPSQAVAEAGDTSKAIKPGNTITGVAKTTETFKTGPPGQNLFYECTIHPTSMSGTIVVS